MKYQTRAGMLGRIAGLCLIGCVVVLGVCQSDLLAQVERGTIAGTVRDPSGAATPNVGITVTNVATGVEYKTQTNDSGEFVAPNLIPGDYSITATLTGFKTLQRKGIVLQVNGRSAVELTLEVGEVTQEVEVTAAAPLLQSESSALGNVISRRDISELPLNGRSVFNLAPLTAGCDDQELPASTQTTPTFPTTRAPRRDCP